MRIIHIIPNLRKGGAEKLVIDIVRTLSTKKEVEVRLVIFDNIVEYPIDSIQDLIVIIPANVQLSLLNKNKFQVTALQEYIESFKPDIIHSHLFKAEIVSRSCTYPKAKWFSHFHDNMSQFENLHVNTFFEKKLLTNYFEKKYLFKRYHINKGTNFICISKDTYQYALNTIAPYKATLLPNAISLEQYKRTVDIPHDSIRIINVGTFVAKKNQQFFIEIAKALFKKTIDFKIVLLGNGELYESIKNKISENKLDDYFSLPGAVSNVPDYLQNANIYVHTATIEPFGLVLVEAMAASLPVVTLDGKGNRDLIDEGKNGFMIDEQDAEKFANTIFDLFNNKQLYQSISAYAYHFSKSFDLNNYIDNLLATYAHA